MEEEWTVDCEKDLGVVDCYYTAQGKTPADVVEKVVGHLRKEHHIDLPDADVILAGEMSDEPLTPGVEPRVELVIRRLWEKLDIHPIKVEAA